MNKTENIANEKVIMTDNGTKIMIKYPESVPDVIQQEKLIAFMTFSQNTNRIILKTLAITADLCYNKNVAKSAVDHRKSEVGHEKEN